MQFTASILFACCILMSTLLSESDARPVKARSPRLITLPLKRVPQNTSNVHPQILLQQHINRALRRQAMAMGEEEPSDQVLRSNIEKRLLSLSDVFSTDSLPAKRYNTFGVPTKPSTSDNTVSNAKSASLAASNDPAFDAKLDSLRPGFFTEADQPAANNSLGLDIIGNDIGYFSTVQIGNPPREFRVIMDSGSSDFWVGGENCDSETGGGCGNHVFLGSLTSTTFEDTQKSWSIQYGSGHVSGNIVRDDVVLAGSVLKGLTFGIASVESNDFAGDTPIDGLMGLARQKISEQNTITPPEALVKAGFIDKAITSFTLGRVTEGENGGEVTFGGLDSSKFDPDTLVTVKNIDQGFWIANMDGVSVNGKDLGLDGRTALLDTGTTLMLVSQDDAEAIHAEIPGADSDGQGGYKVPCKTDATVALSFGGRSFNIKSSDLALFPLEGGPNGNCTSGIGVGKLKNNQWLVGDTFLKSVYFSVNIDDNEISLANLA